MASLGQLAERYGITEPGRGQPKLTSFFARVEPAEQQLAVQQQMAADRDHQRNKRIAEEEEEAARPKRKAAARLRAPAPTTNPKARVRMLQLIRALKDSPEPVLSSSAGKRWRGAAQRARPSLAPR